MSRKTLNCSYLFFSDVPLISMPPKAWPRRYKFVNAQPNMKFPLLKNKKMPTNVGIFIIYRLRKFHTQLQKPNVRISYLLSGDR